MKRTVKRWIMVTFYIIQSEWKVTARSKRKNSRIEKKGIASSVELVSKDNECKGTDVMKSLITAKSRNLVDQKAETRPSR